MSARYTRFLAHESALTNVGTLWDQRGQQTVPFDLKIALTWSMGRMSHPAHPNVFCSSPISSLLVPSEVPKSSRRRSRGSCACEPCRRRLGYRVLRGSGRGRSLYERTERRKSMDAAHRVRNGLDQDSLGCRESRESVKRPTTFAAHQVRLTVLVDLLLKVGGVQRVDKLTNS